MEGLANKLAALHLQTRKVLTVNERTFGLKEGLLFCLVDGAKPTRELIDVLRMKKSNLALLANKCEMDGLIAKQRVPGDGRLVKYALTPAGKKYINGILNEISHKFEKVLTDDNQKSDALTRVEQVSEILSYL